MIYSITPSRSSLRSLASSARTRLRAHSASVDFTSVLSDTPSHAAAQAGASAERGGAGRAGQKGSLSLIHGASTLPPWKPVHQLVQGLDFFMEAPMEQTHFHLLGRVDAPSVVPPAALRLVRSYRDAVRLCWALRRAKGLKVSDRGREHGFTRQHVSDYLNQDDKPSRRSLPPARIGDFEDLCGNCAITQWLASRARLTVLEEIQAERLAA